MTEVGCVILMSKKVFSQLFHSPLADIVMIAVRMYMVVTCSRFIVAVARNRLADQQSALQR